MALNPGDIAFVEFNADGTKTFAFVALVDISDTEQIRFTDNGWLSTNAFRTGEGIVVYNPPAGGITAGTVVRITRTSASTFSATAGTVTNISGDLNLSGSGDQILAYQGTEASPVFIAALNNEGTAQFQPTAADSNTSALPTGLTVGTSAVALTEIDNAVYTGSTTGTKEELQAELFDPANFSGDDTINQTFSGTFTVNSASFVKINEALISHTGTDDTEFVELFGTAGFSLNGLSLIQVDNDANIGRIEFRLDFGAGDSIGANGFFLIGNPTGLGTDYPGVTPNLTIGNESFLNNDSTLALVQTSTLSGGVGTTLTGSEVAVDTIAFQDTSDTGTAGKDFTLLGNPPVLGPDGTFLPAGGERLANGVDTDSAADWELAVFNLGSGNTPTAGGSAFGVTITQSGGTTNVTEGGATDTYTIALNTTPTSAVSITVTPDAQTDLGSGAGVAIILNFTNTTAQTVTVTAFNDSNIEGNHTSTITHSASSSDANYNGITIANVTANITDNDIPPAVGLPVINNFDTNLGAGWTAFSVDSDAANTWFFTSNSGGRAEANGFGDSAAANDWLISPGVNLDSTTGEVVSFTAFTQFTDSGTPNPLQFLYSTNYIGTGNPNSATWTPLSFTAPAANSQTDTSSGNISLNSIAGSNVYFAFQYQSSGTGANNSTLWRVDNFNLRVPTPNITLTQTGAGTAVIEGTGTDTYTIVLDTTPTNPVNITINAPADLEVSTNGTDFFASVILNLSNTTPATVTVRAINDGVSEGIENVAITHTVASTDAIYNAFTIPNVNVTVGDAGIIRIYDIQGASHISPALGLNLTSQGVVTALESNGFYMQDPTGDGNIATSDGIFVFTSSAPTVTVGQSVQVLGTVSEFSGGVNLSITQISSSNANVSVIASLGTVTPTVIGGTPGAGVRIPPNQFIEDDSFTSFDPATDGADFFESLEGMLVTIRDTVVVAPRFGTGGSAEIYVLPDFGAGATGFSTRGTSNIGPLDFNPERIQLDADTNVLPSFNFPSVNVGDRLGNVTGVVTYSSGNYEVNPTQAFTVTPNPTPLTPEVTTLPNLASRAPNQLSIASYNVLNLDPNDGTGPTEAEPDNDIANGRFAKIAQHIVTNLGTPDIIGLQEIQDNDGTANTSTTSASVTLQTLIDAIDLADDGVDNNSLNYAFIDNTFIVDDQSGGAPGGNIRTAFLYNPNRVTFVPGSVGTISTTGAFSTTPANFFDSRPPIVARFTFNGNEITVVNNHLSSKGGSANTFGATAQDFGSRQEDPTVNGSLDERRRQAQAVNNYLDSVLASNPNANIIVTGDMNEFEFVSPLKILAGSEVSSGDGLTVTPSVNPPILLNLTDTLPLNERYSFIFQGNSQSLDHILVSNNLAPFAQMDIVHTNIEFAEATNTASDHDPLVALVNFPIKVAASVGDGTITGTSGNDLINLGNGDNTVNALGGNDVVNGGAGDNTINGGSGNDFLDGAGGNDDIDGGSGNDIIFGGSGDDTLFGGSGDDVISGGSGNDLIDGGTGNDLAVFDGSGNASNFSISVTGTGTVNATAAGLGIDTLLNIEGVQLIGGSGNNTLTGGSGNDFLTGGAGNDTLIGGLGIDTVVETYASGDNTIVLTNTSLKVNGIADASLNGIEQAQLTAGTGNDILDATAFSLGTVTLNAGGGNDTLRGGTKNDILDGGNGNDTLIGGLGTDKLTGGVGSDRFTFDTNAAFSATTIGNDTITDFNFSEDFIVLDRTTFTAFATNAATSTGKAILGTEFAVITESAATELSAVGATTTTALIVYNSTTGNLFYNQNKGTAGLGSGGQFATLQTGLTELQLESRILIAS